MKSNKIKILERALAREKIARKEAEKILEEKSIDLYILAEKFKQTNVVLEDLVFRKNHELKEVFKNIVDAYCVIDMFGNVLEMNQATYNILECGHDCKKLNLLNFVPPDEIDATMKAFNKLKRDKAIKDFKVKIVSQDKQVKRLHINASVIYNENNKPIAIQGIARDITEEQKIKKDLIESENRLRTLILNLDSGIFLEDENRVAIMANKKLCELFYITEPPESMTGKDLSNGAEESKVLFEDPEKFVECYNNTIKKRKTVIGEELRLVDGKILERNYIPIFKDNVFKGHLWSFNDVTLKRKYNINLEAERQKYSSIIANMNMGLVEIDTNNKIAMVNQSFITLTGYSEEELIGMSFIDELPLEQDRNSVSKVAKATIKGKSETFELSINSKSGEVKNILVSTAPNYNINGTVIGSIGVILDFTDFKKLEKQKEALLLSLEKSNDELQEYAHVVSHDLKSPLRSIYALVNWIKEDNQNVLKQESLNNISLIESTLEKMEQLIADILNYSSVTLKTLNPQAVNLNEVIDDLSQILFFPKNIKFKVLNKLPVVYGDRTRLQQLFQNIIANAIKYNDKENGLIEIDVKEKASHFQFLIRDNGIGISEKYHSKIFKIFHSLNNKSDSTGIGLSIVKKIIDLYKGDIWLESELGVGSTFYFTLKK